jgi:hypothetical protein
MNKPILSSPKNLAVAATLALALQVPGAALGSIVLDTTVTGQFNPYTTTTGTNGNDLPGKPSTLYYGQLKATATGLVEFYYVGKEAAYTNTLVYGDSGSYSTAGKPDSFNPSFTLIDSISVTAGSFLDFGFCTDGGDSVGAFGRCAHNDNAASLVAQYNYQSVDGYRSIGYVPLADFNTAGLLDWLAGPPGTSDIWGIFWDDSGARNDDNHDDMIVVARWIPVVSVPEPGVLGLFGLGLVAGAGALRRRFRGATPAAS